MKKIGSDIRGTFLQELEAGGKSVFLQKLEAQKSKNNQQSVDSTNTDRISVTSGNFSTKFDKEKFNQIVEKNREKIIAKKEEFAAMRHKQQPLTYSNLSPIINHKSSNCIESRLLDNISNNEKFNNFFNLIIQMVNEICENDFINVTDNQMQVFSLIINGNKLDDMKEVSIKPEYINELTVRFNNYSNNNTLRGDLALKSLVYGALPSIFIKAENIYIVEKYVTQDLISNITRDLKYKTLSNRDIATYGLQVLQCISKRENIILSKETLDVVASYLSDAEQNKRAMLVFSSMKNNDNISYNHLIDLIKYAALNIVSDSMEDKALCGVFNKVNVLFSYAYELSKKVHHSSNFQIEQFSEKSPYWNKYIILTTISNIKEISYEGVNTINFGITQLLKDENCPKELINLCANFASRNSKIYQLNDEIQDALSDALLTLSIPNDQSQNIRNILALITDVFGGNYDYGKDLEGKDIERKITSYSINNIFKFLISQNKDSLDSGASEVINAIYALQNPPIMQDRDRALEVLDKILSSTVNKLVKDSTITLINAIKDMQY